MLLGVCDDGTVEGVPETSVLSIERNISNVASNPNPFNVSLLVEFERLRDSEGKLVIRVWVPMGPSLYVQGAGLYAGAISSGRTTSSSASARSGCRTSSCSTGQRKSARDVIVRELVCNCLIHREFVSPHIARITIDGEGIRTRNASRALFAGPVTPESLDPTPKNPIIANFFTQMGRSEELGSGTRNLYKFSRLYTGRDPVLEDGDQFTAFVPVPPVMAGMVGNEGNREASKEAERSGAVGGSRRSRTRARRSRARSMTSLPATGLSPHRPLASGLRVWARGR